MVWNIFTKAIFLYLGCLVVLLLRYSIHLFSVRRTLRHVPGPRSSSLFWGEEWLLYHTLPGSHYVRWHQRFGKVVKFTGAFGHQVLSITDPRAISYILGEGIYSFPKPNGVREWFKATLGEGILWVEGKDAHEKQKRSLAPALSQQSVRIMAPMFYETSAKLACQWSKLFDQGSCEDVEIEITNWAGRFALDTVGRAAFSYDFGCLSGEPHALAEALDGLTNNENKLSSFYMRALFWIFPSILSIGTKGEMIRKTKQELGSIASKMWKDAKVVGADERNILAVMLKVNSTDGTKFGEEYIVSQMRTVISAGYEPVSALIAWMLYELASNEHLQQKLREEIWTAGDASFDELNANYPLLDAVFKETLRMHPPILENHHEAAETIAVPLSEPLPGTTECHLIIPKGTILEIPVNVVQTDPTIWGSDAELFRPERWLERKEEGIRHGREIFAFSEGPRSCIGKAFAMCEIKVLMVTLLRQFSFTCSYDIEPFQSFVIRPRIKGQGPSSLPLRVRKL
ncbi:cytochrome P450 [Armillaria borealis]|uniref:Cytochrome P450 n=1 Tax=Armillaria borealis TaxID=47425 RepID=A0AA39K7B3_9AGAR|nr:cytochrome P450 [Armillaria borealis]